MQERSRTMQYLCTLNTLKGLLNQAEFLFKIGTICTLVERNKNSKGGNIKYLYDHFVPIKMIGICTVDVMSS